MWKFHDFPITQILREIKFGNSRSAKSANLTNLGAVNFDYLRIFALWKVEIIKSTQFPAPKLAKMAISELLVSPKLISHKI